MSKSHEVFVSAGSSSALRVLHSHMHSTLLHAALIRMTPYTHLSGIPKYAYRQEYITPQSVQRLIQLCVGSWSSEIGSLRHNTVHI